METVNQFILWITLKCWKSLYKINDKSWKDVGQMVEYKNILKKNLIIKNTSIILWWQVNCCFLV